MVVSVVMVAEMLEEASVVDVLVAAEKTAEVARWIVAEVARKIIAVIVVVVVAVVMVLLTTLASAAAVVAAVHFQAHSLLVLG